MSESLHMREVEHQDEPLYTLQEILQQPVLWPTTVARVRTASERLNLKAAIRGACPVDGCRQFGLCSLKRSLSLARRDGRSHHGPARGC